MKIKARLAAYVAGGLVVVAGVALATAVPAAPTLSVCATTPAQTLADNGTPIATVPSQVACATTALTTTAAPTFASAISYTSTPAPFTPTREVDVATAAALKAAIAAVQPGDLIKATAAFTVAGETIVAARPASTAVIDLRAGVKFAYSAAANLPAVWLNNAANLRIYGGDLSTADTGGACLLDYGSQHVLWWGFAEHDCGGSGLAVFTVGAAVDHLDLYGSVTKVGQHLAWDPHAEKGTGLHGAILWDAGTAYAFTNSRFALDEHDIPVGACVEIGNSAAAPAGGNTLILRCVNETDVSTTQTGGNALELWGATTTLGLDIPYIEVANAQGRAVQSGGINAGQTAAGVVVEYGRATNTNLNPALDGGARPGVRWDTVGLPAYRDVLPIP